MAKPHARGDPPLLLLLPKVAEMPILFEYLQRTTVVCGGRRTEKKHTKSRIWRGLHKSSLWPPPSRRYAAHLDTKGMPLKLNYRWLWAFLDAEIRLPSSSSSLPCFALCSTLLLAVCCNIKQHKFQVSAVNIKENEVWEEPCSIKFYFIQIPFVISILQSTLDLISVGLYWSQGKRTLYTKQTHSSGPTKWNNKHYLYN